MVDLLTRKYLAMSIIILPSASMSRTLPFCSRVTGHLLGSPSSSFEYDKHTTENKMQLMLEEATMRMGQGGWLGNVGVGEQERLGIG